MNPLDQRQDGNAGDTSLRDMIDVASEDYDLDPFTETVEDAELDELLGSSSRPGASEGAKDTPETGSFDEAARGVGIDAVLQEAEDKLGPEYARVIRNLQGEYTRGRQEIADEKRAREELTERFDKISSQLEDLNSSSGEGLEDDSDTSALQSAITDDHRQLFRMMLSELGPEWATENGYVKTGDLSRMKQQEEAVSARQSELNDSVSMGIERYGDAFGHRSEDGKFILNPETKERMATVYERLTRNLPEGVQFPGTVLDIYELTFSGDEAVKRNTENDRREELGRLGGIANDSASGTGSLAWYKPGESFGKTIRKASALAAREISRGRR